MKSQKDNNTAASPSFHKKLTTEKLSIDDFVKIVNSIGKRSERRRVVESKHWLCFICLICAIGLFAAAGTNIFGFVFPRECLTGAGAILMGPVAIYVGKR